MLAGTKIIQADVLIVGSGLAGLLLALKLSENSDLSIVIAAKGALTDSNSALAQGGVAAVTEANSLDSSFTHLVDTLKSGAGLSDERVAHSIIFSGARLIEELHAQGVSFDQDQQGAYSLALEGGHSQARVVHN